MTDILQRLVDAQLDHNTWQWGWAAEAADEIRKLRLEYDAMVRSRDDWYAVAGRKAYEIGMCVDELDAVRAERDDWQALAAAADADAQRYRYLRDRNRDDVLLKSGPSAGVWCDCEDENGDLILLTGEDLDAAIDAALEEDR